MASVTFPEELGGNGQTYTDNADPEAGLDGLGYTVRFIPCLQQAVAMGLSAKSSASAAASYVQQCQTLRQQVAGDRQAVADDRAHVDQQKGLVDTAAAAAQQSAASVNADNIVHKPGSGLPNEAGEAFSRGVVGGSGRLMAEGFNGLGGDINYGLESDFLTLPFGAVGNLSSSSIPTSAPLAESARYAGFKLGNVNAELLMVAAVPVAGNPIFARVKSATGWDSAYRKMLSSLDVIGAIGSFGSGPYLGSLFELGSNADGSYLRLPGGFQICWAYLDLTQVVSNALSATWVFPRPFSSPVTPFATTDENSASRIDVGRGEENVMSAASGTVSSDIRARNLAANWPSTARLNNTFVFAIGRFTP